MEVTQFFRDSKDDIWLVSRPYGVFRFDKKGQKFVGASSFLASFNWKVHYMAEEPGTGNFWLGSDSGLAYCNTRRHEIYHYKHNPLQVPLLKNPAFYHVAVTGLFLDSNRQFWFNTFWSGYPYNTKIRYENYRYNFSKSLHTYTLLLRVIIFTLLINTKTFGF